MKKLLFTDLLGTLICHSQRDSIKYYNSLEKEIYLVSRYINLFLKCGNYVVIVAEHYKKNDEIDAIFNKILSKLDSYIDNNVRSHLSYYLVNQFTVGENSNIKINEKNGRKLYTNKVIECVYSLKKEDAVLDFLANHREPFYIYGIGDSCRDIPMLLKIKELGGQSSFMNLDIYRFPVTYDEIINRQLDIEFTFKLYNLFNEERKKGESLDSCSKEELDLLEKREIRKKQLYQELYNGNLNLDEINRKYSILSECESYYYQYGTSYNKNLVDDFWYNYPFNQKMVDSMLEMSCYSSFNEYYAKVLKN